MNKSLLEPAELLREREISRILERYFDDYATPRRELINHRLMKRQAGVYWKAS